MKTTHEKIKTLVASGEFTLAELKDYFTSWIFEPQLIEETKSHKLYGCPSCGSKISIYKVNFSKMHLEILIKIFKWCVKNKTHEFHKSEIKGLSHTEYGNFYTLQRFWLLYFLKSPEGKRVKGWYWGLPLKRVYKFLQGQTKIAEYYTRNTATGQNIPAENKVCVQEIKNYWVCFDWITPAFLEYEELEKIEEVKKQVEAAKKAYSTDHEQALAFATSTFKR